VTRKIGVVASSTFPLSTAVGAEVVDCLRAFGPDTLFLTRGAGPFEQFIATAALVLGARCFTYPGEGGRANLDRDDALVADCEELVAFLDQRALETGPTLYGTTGVIERALRAGRPVRAATAIDGALVWAS
jgi:hypothetical protein